MSGFGESVVRFVAQDRRGDAQTLEVTDREWDRLCTYYGRYASLTPDALHALASKAWAEAVQKRERMTIATLVRRAVQARPR